MATAKLVGTGNAGNFVHQSQEMGTGEGFKNVSKHWLDTGCLTYSQVIDRIERGKAEIEDFRVPLGRFQPTVNDAGKFVFRHQDGNDYSPTQYSLVNVAKMCDISTWQASRLSQPITDRDGNVIRTPDAQDAETLRVLIANGLRRLDAKKKYLFRTQKDGTLRAVLSEQYVIMDNHWFLETLVSIIPDGRFSHWRDDGDRSTLWGNILIPDSIREEQDSDYGGMVSISNSEIGRRVLGCTPSVFRAICMNGCIWDQTKGTKFKQVHRGKVEHAPLRERLREHIHSQIPLITTAIDALLAKRDIVWDGASVRPIFAKVADRHHLSKRAATDIYRAWQEEANETPPLKKTAFAFVNAVTRSGRKSPDPATWVERDTLGGTLAAMDAKKWNSLFRDAKHMDAEEVDSHFMSVN